MNRVFLSGGVANLETKQSKTGTAIANFTICVNSNVKVNEQWEKKTTFIRCVAFGKNAENLQKFDGQIRELHDVEGRVEVDNYEKDGKKMSKTYVVIDKFRIEFKNDNRDNVKKADFNKELSNKMNEEPEDDLPF